MNKLGQSSVIFIILIPVFLFITAIIVDTGINVYNEKKLKNVTEDVLTYLLENNVIEEDLITKAKVIYERNDIDTEYLRVEILNSDKISISNTNSSYSFMNSLFNRGSGNRQTSVDAVGYIENDKVIITFEGDNNED